jgi:hypothetical protein
MDSYYEFIVKQQDQLITLSLRAIYPHSDRKRRVSTWGRFIGRCGDALIDCGSWMKRVSNSPIDENSVGFFTRN